MASQRTVLLIAYHFPPVQGSSGVQRTLRFAQHLPKYGWRPIVLSIDTRAYESTAQVVGNEAPAGLEVHRAFGFNTATQLSIFGRYPATLALPDRWATWRYWAVPNGMRIIREQRVDALWSTFPISTAHLIGLQLARKSRLPWLAEFRDPMWQSDWPPEPRANRAWQALEREIFATAQRAIFVAPGAIEMYAERFPQIERRKFALVENGYDEETFRRAAGAEQATPTATLGAAEDRPITLLHSGIIYSSERDPTQFFAAIAELKAQGAVSAKSLRIVLRASGTETNFRAELERLGISDIVQLQPSVDYVSALREMLTVDGLLILQAANCNAQVPAKLYEYLRADRPILALTDPKGDTARTLDAAGAGLVARLDSVADIREALPRFIRQIRSGDWRRASRETVAGYSREAQAAKLAALLDEARGAQV
jgi:glycosyltransferase involved in cell wall biosynthesis